MIPILAIDPGPTLSAFVIFDGAKILAHDEVENERLLWAIVGAVWAEEIQPRRCAVEMVTSYGMPVGAEVFQTCVWIGRFAEAWDLRAEARRDGQVLPAVLVPRLEVKLHLCHDSRAKDANIRQALVDRLGPSGTKKAPGPTHDIHRHEWSALALAVAAFDQMQQEAA
jgi:hypothetical protein